MSLPTAASVAALIASDIYTADFPTGLTAAQTAAGNTPTSVKAQIAAAYQPVVQRIFDAFTGNATVTVSVPASGLLDHGGGTCSGTATGTGAIS
jgi:hypothetical protein